MSDVFFKTLGIPDPDYHLNVGSGSHGQQTGEMLARLEQVFLQERPNLVLVDGDTNSTLAGALAAAKLHIPVAHIEAGMRSFNRRAPEEINRVLVDHLSTLLLAPTERAVENLRREGISQGVHLVGDLMCDALLHFLPIARRTSSILERLDVNPHGYTLATVHRAENLEEPERLKQILQALSALSERVVLPVHPHTAQRVKEYQFTDLVDNSQIHRVDPVGYLDMLVLEENARLIVTDSGGVQREAYMLGVPCLTIRDETEWVETVEAGWNILTGVAPERILHAASTISPPISRPPFLGDGRAAERIISVLEADVTV
jgi:UDP-N-acetylglucosamine 2-epimerase (non-hydrolysing)/UDP-GlcNAc3NAcA epimerase